MSAWERLEAAICAMSAAEVESHVKELLKQIANIPMDYPTGEVIRLVLIVHKYLFPRATLHTDVSVAKIKPGRTEYEEAFASFERIRKTAIYKRCAPGANTGDPDDDIVLVVVVNKLNDSLFKKAHKNGVADKMASMLEEAGCDKKIVQYKKTTKIPSSMANCATCGVSQASSSGSKKVKLRKCARCACVFYCSVTCQRSDWKAHKPDCVSPNN